MQISLFLWKYLVLYKTITDSNSFHIISFLWKFKQQTECTSFQNEQDRYGNDYFECFVNFYLSINCLVFVIKICKNTTRNLNTIVVQL